MERINAGYRITDNISLEGKQYALGEDPNNPARYVVWETDADMKNFYRGHYFTEKPSAIADMIQRATHELERPDGMPLSVDFLTEYARNALAAQMRDQNAYDDILPVLEDLLQDNIVFPTTLTAEDILANPQFLSAAINIYDNIDHSAENEALMDSLETLLRECPEYLKPAPKPSLDQIITGAEEKANTAGHFQDICHDKDVPQPQR